MVAPNAAAAALDALSMNNDSDVDVAAVDQAAAVAVLVAATLHGNTGHLQHRHWQEYKRSSRE